MHEGIGLRTLMNQCELLKGVSVLLTECYHVDLGASSSQEVEVTSLGSVLRAVYHKPSFRLCNGVASAKRNRRELESTCQTFHLDAVGRGQ